MVAIVQQNRRRSADVNSSKIMQFAYSIRLFIHPEQALDIGLRRFQH